MISVRSKNNLTDVAECENNIRFWVVIDEIPVSQMQPNVLVVPTAQKFQAKASSDSACDESFPVLHPGLSLDTGRIDVGLHPGENL